VVEWALLCGDGTTKSNSNELAISVPLSFIDGRNIDQLGSCLQIE